MRRKDRPLRAAALLDRSRAKGRLAAMTKSVDDCLVWMDLEMTGLEVERHVIVEVACLATDANLQPLDEGIDVVVKASDDELAEMGEFVTEMHRRSGLLDEIRQAQLTLADAEAQALAYVKQHVRSPRSAPLCGNSIGMDRRFVARYMPLLDDYLHYRHIDVSSFKELCRRWYPAEYAKRPDKSETHRAAEDIRESIEELRYYRSAILKAPDTD